MDLTVSDNPQRGEPKTGSIWSHVLVSLCACILTVSIVGSIVFLAWRIYDRGQLSARVKTFVASLQDRTPEELASRAENLKAHPKVARFVLPELSKSIVHAGSEQQQWAAIEVSRAFLADKKVEKTLFALRSDPSERVAAAAVRALAELQPPAHAAKIMAQCLTDARTGAAVDEACRALYRLGDDGCAEMEKRLPKLSAGRRVWLVGYVDAMDGPNRRAWLKMLASAGEPRVRAAAERALGRRTAEQASLSSARVDSPVASDP